jgi:hypothetical protein
MVIFDGLLLKVVIIESQSLLSTVRTINNNFIAVVFALLGSVFGLMGTVGAVMSLVENSTEAVRNKIEKILRLGKVKNQRKYLNFNFFQNSEMPKIRGYMYEKIHPDPDASKTVVLKGNRA